MADLTIPAGVVTVRVGDPTLTKVMQVAGTHGQLIYEDLSNGGKFNLCDNDAQASAKIKGILLVDVGAGGRGEIALPGAVVTFASAVTGATKGVVYYVSGTAGGIAPVADVTTGKYVTLALLALSTTQFLVLGVIGDYVI